MQFNQMRKAALIIGASAGVGRSLAESLAAEGWNLILSARDQIDLQLISHDLEIRYNIDACSVTLDLAERYFDATSFVERCRSEFPRISALFVTAGHADDGDTVDCLVDDNIDRICSVNFLSVAKLVQAFVPMFMQQRYGKVVLISSIAAGAPRGRNIIYSASKAALEMFGLSLRHALDASGVGVQVIRLGYIDTSMSFGKKLWFPLASPQSAAKFIVKNLPSRRHLAYFPWFWRPIVITLRILPWFLYKRLKF